MRGYSCQHYSPPTRTSRPRCADNSIAARIDATIDGAATEAEYTARDIVKSWIVNLNLGNGPTDDALVEMWKSLLRLCEAEREEIRKLIVEVLERCEEQDDSEMQRPW